MVRKISKLSDVLTGAENTFGGHPAPALKRNSQTLDFEVAPSTVTTGQAGHTSQRCQNTGNNYENFVVDVVEKKDKLQPLTPFEIALERAQQNKSVQ